MVYCNKCNNKYGTLDGWDVIMTGHCQMCGEQATPPQEDSSETNRMFNVLNDLNSLSRSQQIFLLAFIADALSLDVTANAIRDSLNN